MIKPFLRHYFIPGLHNHKLQIVILVNNWYMLQSRLTNWRKHPKTSFNKSSWQYKMKYILEEANNHWSVGVATIIGGKEVKVLVSWSIRPEQIRAQVLDGSKNILKIFVTVGQPHGRHCNLKKQKETVFYWGNKYLCTSSRHKYAIWYMDAPLEDDLFTSPDKF